MLRPNFLREKEFYVIGSSAIHVVFEFPTDYFLSRTNEADIIALSGDLNAANKISDSMGELSPHHENYDVYADACSFDTPTYAPDGWRDRAIPVEFTDIGIKAFFMELYNLFLSKLGAG